MRLLKEYWEWMKLWKRNLEEEMPGARAREWDFEREDSPTEPWAFYPEPEDDWEGRLASSERRFAPPRC